MMRLSVTQILTWLRCPAQYDYRYRRGIMIPPTAALAFGIAFDHSISYGYGEKYLLGTEPKVSTLVEYFASEYESLSQEVVYVDEDPAEEKDTGVELVREYHRSVLRRVIPEAVQPHFQRELPGVGVELFGIADLVAAPGIVVDLKTSRRLANSISPGHRFQLSAYCWLRHDGRAPYRSQPAQIHLAVKPTKTIAVLETEIDDNDTQWVEGVTEYVARAVEEEIFPPNRDHPFCSRRWCGFWQICEEEHGGRVKP